MAALQACEWCGMMSVCFSAAFSVAVVHGLHLLHLVGRQDDGELLLGVFACGAHLPVFLLWGEGRVALQGHHLLLAVGEDGVDLRGLVYREAELLPRHRPSC